MSQAADKAIQRWVDRMTGRTDRGYLSSGNILCREDAIYSYGSHFEMARPLRDKKGKIHAFLLNGDTYSNTTTGHQSTVRQTLARTGIQQVIIPHEALHGAGIDLDSIQLVNVSPDRSETIQHHYTERQPSWVVKREPNNQWVDHRWTNLGDHDVLYTSARRGADSIDIDVDDEGVTHYRWTTYRHWLGESLIRAKVWWSVWHACQWCEGTGRGIGPAQHWTYYCRGCHGDRGASTRHHRWAYFLSGFDHAEARPLYFLCELPRGAKPATVAEAYEALKPEPVKMAEQMNRTVERQGDIFAVPTELDRKVLKAMGARIERRGVGRVPRDQDRATINFPYILNTNHTATEVAYLPDGVTLARGTMYHDPADRPQDHARHRLGDGKTWHIVIKNTVPTTVRR